LHVDWSYESIGLVGSEKILIISWIC